MNVEHLTLALWRQESVEGEEGRINIAPVGAPVKLVTNRSALQRLGKNFYGVHVPIDAPEGSYVITVGVDTAKKQRGTGGHG